MLMSTETALLIAARDEITRLKEQLEAQKVVLQLIDAACQNFNIQGSGALLAADIRAHIRVVSSPASGSSNVSADTLRRQGFTWTGDSNQDSAPAKERS